MLYCRRLQDKYLQGRANRLRRILREASVVVDAMAVSASSGGSGGANIPSEALISRGVDQPASWAFSLPPTASPGSLQLGSLLQAPTLKQFVRVLDEKVINAMQVGASIPSCLLQCAHMKPKPEYLSHQFPGDCGQCSSLLPARRRPVPSEAEVPGRAVPGGVWRVLQSGQVSRNRLS